MASFGFETCNLHPFGAPWICNYCYFLLTIQGQTTDLAAPRASIYPDPEAPAIQTLSYYEEVSAAPPAVPSTLHQPIPIRALKTSIITRTTHPAVHTHAEHDFYPERFALSPSERMRPYAGRHSSDRLALDEDDLASGSPDDFVLSDNEVEVPPVGPGGKKRSANEMDDAPSMTADSHTCGSCGMNRSQNHRPRKRVKRRHVKKSRLNSRVRGEMIDEDMDEEFQPEREGSDHDSDSSHVIVFDPPQERASKRARRMSIASDTVPVLRRSRRSALRHNYEE